LIEQTAPGDSLRFTYREAVARMIRGYYVKPAR